MREEQVLRYAARPRVVLKHAGELLVAAGVLAFAPAVVALVCGEAGYAADYAGAALLLVGAGALAARVPAPGDLRTNEALAIVAVVFLLTPVAMTWPLSRAGVPVTDAFFEALSGITTTGLTTLASVERLPRSFLFARAWLQWIGGLGIVVLSLALLAHSGIAGRRLELATGDGEDLLGSTRAHARRMLRAYGALTGAGIVLLLVAGLGLFDAVAHALASVSTGGFATRDRSLAALEGWAPAGITCLSLAGAISLPLYLRAVRNGVRAFFADVELQLLLVLCVAASFFAGWLGGLGWGDSFLLGISAQSTTGFSSVDVHALTPGAKGVLLLAMATGGCVGSTAGGAKMLRMLLAFEIVRWTLQRTGMPSRAVHDPVLRGERLEAGEIQRAFVVLALFPTVVAFSWVPFLAAGHDPMDSLFEVVSATGTVGLSTGVASPDLHPALKGVLCLDMWLGRLEIVAVLALLAPRTWIGRRAD